MGCRVGKNVFIGYEVWMDFNHASLIEIEDDVHITNRCLLLCHQRNLENYYEGDDASKLPYSKNKIHLKKGCHIGMGTIILPGVTVGQGAIIGAGSVIARDIPAWTIAKGNPASVSKYIPPRRHEHLNI
jgi:acetyltransferase-like isoleucine patch superfamily enzyme